MVTTIPASKRGEIFECLLALGYYREEYLVDLVILLGLDSTFIKQEFGIGYGELRVKFNAFLKENLIGYQGPQGKWRGVDALLGDKGRYNEGVEYLNHYHTTAESPKESIDRLAFIESYLNHVGDPTTPSHLTFNLAYMLARDYKTGALAIDHCQTCGSFVVITDTRRVGSHDCCRHKSSNPDPSTSLELGIQEHTSDTTTQDHPMSVQN